MAFGNRDDNGKYRSPWWVGAAGIATLLIGLPAMVGGTTAFADRAGWEGWAGSLFGLALVSAAIVTYLEGVGQAREPRIPPRSRRPRSAMPESNPSLSERSDATLAEDPLPRQAPPGIAEKVEAHDAYLRGLRRMRRRQAEMAEMPETDFRRGWRAALLELATYVGEEGRRGDVGLTSSEG